MRWVQSAYAYIKRDERVAKNENCTEIMRQNSSKCHVKLDPIHQLSNWYTLLFKDIKSF